MGWVICSWCGNKFLKQIRHINENLKLGHKFYCSKACFSSSKNRQIELICNNPNCKNTFKRVPKNISLHNFCSRSCSAIHRNIQKWGFPKPKIILSEEDTWAIKIAASSLGGTNRWKNYISRYSKEYIIKSIQDFMHKNSRVPLKKEMNIMYKQARIIFGTWNNAIKAAGFNPNPVMFANHHKAKDGHICDSLAEKIIDDYLFKRGIAHQRNFPYPEGTYTADFKIGNKLIEYFGLSGEHKRYDELKTIKKKLIKKYGLNLIEIYPNNLFPTSGLDIVLKDFTIEGRPRSREFNSPVPD